MESKIPRPKTKNPRPNVENLKVVEQKTDYRPSAKIRAKKPRNPRENRMALFENPRKTPKSACKAVRKKSPAAKKCDQSHIEINFARQNSAADEKAIPQNVDTFASLSGRHFAQRRKNGLDNES
ncbi:MAG: hypothetical protein IT426_08810 [Pirellulales bacterium]|nr:hypothetical protein [Pirellulales bacterium]